MAQLILCRGFVVLFDLHNSLCHPGISRMMHFTRSRNLPYSTNEVKTVIEKCPICTEIKPSFVKNSSTLIKSTQPFERLNIDFKGPLPNEADSSNRYLLPFLSRICPHKRLSIV